MSNPVIIPEFKIRKNFKKKKIFINQNSYDLNINCFNKNDKIIDYIDLYRNERIKEFKYIKKITSDILDLFKLTLNEINLENHSKRYWEIIIGPWLHYFVCSTRNRYKKIQLIIDKNKNAYFLGNFKFNKNLIPQDTKHFQSLHCENGWNNYIYFKIFRHLRKDKILNITYELDIKKYHKKKNKKSFRYYVDCFFKNLDSKKNKVFIHNSGMNIANEFLLNILLMQIPRFYNDDTSKLFTINRKSRELLKNKFKKNHSIKNDNFFNFLIEAIPDQLPLNILEGYKSCKESCMNQGYPKNPKVIFTSNSFDTNEMFKFYTANMIDRENPSKYIVGQHGNSYNTNISNSFMTEITTSDKFINWGIKKKNQIPFCNFISKPEKYSKSKKKYLLIMLRSKGLKYSLWDRELHSLYYENYLIKFLNGIDFEKVSNILIKPHYSHDLNNAFFKKLRLNFPNIKILSPSIKINKFYKNCRLIVYNYDGTSYLQLLSSNFPAVAFWPGNDNHVIKEMINSYQILKRNSLWSSNPDDISALINKHWNNLETWWFDKKRQQSIEHVKKKLCIPRKKFFLFKLSKIIRYHYL